mgnify:CR=1 FL=1
MSTENTDPLQAADQADSPHAAHAESVSIDSVVDVAIKQFSRCLLYTSDAADE